VSRSDIWPCGVVGHIFLTRPPPDINYIGTLTFHCSCTSLYLRTPDVPRNGLLENSTLSLHNFGTFHPALSKDAPTACSPVLAVSHADHIIFSNMGSTYAHAMEGPAAGAPELSPSHCPSTLDEALWSCDFVSVNQKLEERASSLFSRDVNELELWAAAVTPESSDVSTSAVVQKHSFNGCDPSLSLERLANQHRQAKDLFYIIHQAHTWDRLLVTRQVFSGLMERENVFPYFLDTVFAFGVRTKYDDNTWPNFHSRVSYPAAGESVDGFGGYGKHSIPHFLNVSH
jgi:hypothetical protein